MYNNIIQTMEDSGQIFCRLCLNSISNKNFTVIDKTSKEILKTVLLNLDFVDNHKHVMCSTCSIKLYAAFDFKSTCLYVEEKIASYINPKVSYIDLREVYLKEQDNKIKMEDDQRICRLCLQLVTEKLVSVHEIKLDLINKYIPEVNFSATVDPVICKRCFDSLSTHETFLRTCLDIEMKTHNIHFVPCNTFIKSESEEIKLGDQHKQERLVKIEELQADETLIKSEEVDTKCEREKCGSAKSVKIIVKRCFVPCCFNTSENTDKRFISVPYGSRREYWFKAIGKPLVKTFMYCCEDHFELENDAVNWRKHIYVGTKLVLKEHVVPHLYLKRACPDIFTSQIKTKKMAVEEQPGPSKGSISFSPI